MHGKIEAKNHQNGALFIITLPKQKIRIEEKPPAPAKSSTTL